MPGLFSSIFRCAIGGIYVLSGISKVFPFTADMAKELKMEFKAYAKVYPTIPLGYQPDPEFYQHSLGVLELGLGLGLLFGPLKLQKVCCGSLILLMVGGAQTMLCLGRYGMAVIPLAFVGALSYIWMLLGSSEGGKKQQ